MAESYAPHVRAYRAGPKRIFDGRMYPVSLTRNYPKVMFLGTLYEVKGGTVKQIIRKESVEVPQERLTDYGDLFRVLVETSTDLILVTDGEGRISYANQAARETLGYEPEEMIGAHLSAFVAAEFEAEAASVSERAARGRPQNARHIVGRCRDGSAPNLRLSATPLTGSDDELQEAAMIITDVSAQEQRERELAQLIRDNELILRSVGDGIIRIDPQGRITYANPAAGQILGCNHAELMGRDAHELLHHSHADGSPYPIEQCPIHASLRGEVVHHSDEVFWRPDGTSFAVNYTSAPIREDGATVGAVCVFADISDEKDREQELLWELEWQQRITRAVKSDRLIAFSQPIIDLDTGDPVQEELLVRMKGRGEDIVPPIDFLPTAERLDVICAIDRWMLAKALELVADGRTVAVNISARSLTELRLLEDVRRSLGSSGADPSRLIFEITETAASENAAAARRFAEGVAKLGCRLALDDFGTGFGAMTYLKSLPAHFLKIDMDFVRGLCSDEGNQRIVRTIVDIARSYGQRTIAEGVEDAETATLLRQYGVDFAQGYLYGEAAPID
jgi:PAS domain S-box-containing protein